MLKKVSLLLFVCMQSSSLFATTLEELIQSGLKHNSVIQKSDLEIELMHTKKVENQAKKLGSIDLVGSYTHYNLPRTLAPIVPSSLSPSSSIDTTQDLWSTGIQYTVPLFTGGLLEEQIEIDKLSEKMSESKKRLSREELIYNIRSLYISALSLQEIMLSQENYIKTLETLSDTILYGFQLGKKAKIEHLKAQNDLQKAKSEWVITKTSLDTIKSTLSVITHYQDINGLEAVEVEIKEDTLLSDTEKLDELERFKIQNLDIEKNSRMIKKSESLKKPQVQLNLYTGYNYDFDQSDPMEREQLWQIALNLKWNIVDFGSNSAKVQQAKIMKLQSMVAQEATTEGFRKLFLKAHNEIVQAIENYKSNRSQYDLLEETQKIEEVRYQSGVATLNDLLLAKSKTLLAQSKMIQSKYAYQNGIYYLDYLLERGEK